MRGFTKPVGTTCGAVSTSTQGAAGDPRRVNAFHHASEPVVSAPNKREHSPGAPLLPLFSVNLEPNMRVLLHATLLG